MTISFSLFPSQSHHVCKNPKLISNQFNLYGKSPLIVYFFLNYAELRKRGQDVLISRREKTEMVPYPCHLPCLQRQRVRRRMQALLQSLAHSGYLVGAAMVCTSGIESCSQAQVSLKSRPGDPEHVEFPHGQSHLLLIFQHELRYHSLPDVHWPKSVGPSTLVSVCEFHLTSSSHAPPQLPFGVGVKLSSWGAGAACVGILSLSNNTLGSEHEFYWESICCFFK